MLLQELKNRNLPELKSREEMIEILQSEIYGKKLPDPEKVEFIKETEPLVPRFCASKASIYRRKDSLGIPRTNCLKSLFSAHL